MFTYKEKQLIVDSLLFAHSSENDVTTNEAAKTLIAKVKKSEKPDALPKWLRNQKQGMFAERSTMQEAFDYAESMTSGQPIVGLTVGAVTMNTLLETIAKDIEEERK